MGRLDGKVAMVTGAGQGIGRAIAEELEAEGATVVATDLVPSASVVACDVTDPDAVRAVVRGVHQDHGRIDVLVNNAGWDVAAPFVDSDPADWDRVIRINLYGTLHTCKEVLPIMVAQGAGAVVNLGSDAGRVGSSGEAVYSAAKGGIIAFTKAVAREVARHGVRVNCVSPGPTDTALFASMGGDDPRLRDALVRAIPMRRLAQPADIAHAVAFYASDEAAFITGQTISVSGGLTMS
jgi:2-hydroxycyclohexanecarboxyl-CoA dehydrogenase